MVGCDNREQVRPQKRVSASLSRFFISFQWFERVLTSTSYLSQCPIEWFHMECVGLTGPVKGKWLCPNCREKEKKK